MQNSNNQPSASDSKTTTTAQTPQTPTNPHGNGRANGTGRANSTPIPVVAKAEAGASNIEAPALQVLESDGIEAVVNGNGYKEAAPTVEEVHPEVYRNGKDSVDANMQIDLTETGTFVIPDDLADEGETITEPDFLEAISTEGDAPGPEDAVSRASGAVQFAPTYKPEDMVKPPTLDPADVVHHSRSLQMQWRFVRTLTWAGWLFARLIFWQYYVAKIFPGWVDSTNMGRWKRYARQYSKFAASMGGVFIKLGQFISTRVDIVPEEIVRELEDLQDEVPTIAFSKIRYVAERELGPLENRYEYFNEEPVAAASLGQVHRARLLNGDKVVVKVQRPGIRELCFTDLAAMRIIARIAMRFRFISRRCDAPALIEEFGRVFLEELSYNHEAYNARRFSQMFKDDMGVYIPHIYPEHSTDLVLTIEDVTTIKINDYEALEKAGISRAQVAKRVMDTYLLQIFEHYFFHADPHPGNLFIYPLPVENENANFGPKGRPFYLIFIDFGMTGTLSHEIADGMVNTLSAILSRDAARLVDSYVRLGFILPGADIPRLVEATKKAFDQVWGLSMTDMRDMDYQRVAEVAEEFSDLMLSMPFYIPQDFIYLGRTVSIISGMTTSLDPEFNPWNGLQPYTEVLIARGFGIDIPDGQFLSSNTLVQGLLTGNTEVLRTFGQEVLKRTISPPSPTSELVEMFKEGEVHIVADLSAAHRQQLKRLETETRRNSRSVFFGSVLIASTLLYTNGDTTIAVAGFVLCGLIMLFGFLRD